MTEPSAELVDHALIEEAAKKSALLWVRAEAGGPDRALWHAWHEGAVNVVVGGDEQPAPAELGSGAVVRITLRSKDKWGRLVAFPARVEELAPRTEAWQAAAEELKAKRLNSPDFEGVLDRWAASSTVLRLVPSGPSVENPERFPADAHLATPVPTSATTRNPQPAGLPKLLLRKLRKRA
ncbi:hypothetical protein [Streptacidiphilus monticola]|uniref:Uncharacterized protein n=1 Tax=Streptacidiphilus monticola TaxID=2161674 RepID=A0ABW1G123_9ACTN